MSGRYKRYRTAGALRKAVEGYFASISRIRPVQELVNTGEKDCWGHFILVLEDVKNDAGETVTERVFSVPPTVGGLCAYLGVSRDTWARYCDWEENPQFAETTQWAREQLLAWRETELLRRPGNKLRGLELDLIANYGYGAKIAAGGKPERPAKSRPPMTTAEKLALLEEVWEEGGDGGDGD